MNEKQLTLLHITSTPDVFKIQLTWNTVITKSSLGYNTQVIKKKRDDLVIDAFFLFYLFTQSSLNHLQEPKTL